jgi:hypothetical protein
MIFAIARAIRHGAVFPDLVIIGSLTGAGFALVYSGLARSRLLEPGARHGTRRLAAVIR